MTRLVAAALGLGLCAFGVSALAHNGVEHGSAAEAEAHSEALAAAPAARDGADAPTENSAPPLPLPSGIGGAYALTDHFGQTRTERDPDGLPQLVFFGYANCPAICSVALPRMAETVDLLAQQGVEVRPLLITVDPERDTPEAMSRAVPAIHERMIGLTGSEEALAEARAAFQVERELVTVMPDYGAIYSHGSYVYLMDAEGEFLTLMPPILGSDRMAEIAARYLGGS